MEETIAELRRQLEEAERRQGEADELQGEAERRQREAKRLQGEAERRQGGGTTPGRAERRQREAKRLQGEAERRQREAERRQREADDARERRNDMCSPTHYSPFSIAATTICLKRSESRRMQPHDSGRCDQPAPGASLEETRPHGCLNLAPLFPSDTQIDYVFANIQNRPIYSEASLRNFERDTVDNFVEMVIKALRDDEVFRHEFGIQGQVTFYDRMNLSETSLQNSLEQMNLQDVRTPQRFANTRPGRRRGRGRGAMQGNNRDGTTRRRNRRADQFCVHRMADERQIPIYAVEFKAPHKEGDTFEFHATYLVAAVVTQIFSYMIDIGVQYGYICTGEAFVFLYIPEDDPTVVQYFLCIPNQDVQADDELRLHRTAIGQVLAFTLQALAAKAPSQEWHDAAYDKLETWDVEYLDVLRKIPETLRKDPRASNYRPSHWKLEPKTHNTRSRARCKPDISTPKHSSTEGSGSDEESHSPSIAAAARSGSSRGRGNNRQSTKESESKRAGQNNKQTSKRWAIYTTLLHNCLTAGVHTPASPPTYPKPKPWFEQLHVCGRTGYLVKATLLSHGYTVVIKATTMEKQHRLQAEANNYRHLRSLQGNQIPVCLGTFTPQVLYWYHGELMAQMMILSWSGKRLQYIINDENSRFFHQERDKALTVLRSHGVIHGDSEWRNMLWDDLGARLFVIDLEEVKWLKCPRALEPTFGNMRHSHRVGWEK
ncbi:hypothetical protein PDIDSM_3450 [Penicillium digitatum]|nr:hypothetical protein PDIDSM_3450 [Penicillium digitatum]